MNIAAAFLPIILVMGCGWLLRRLDWLDDSQWDGIELLSFRVLIPAMLVTVIARADLDPARIAPLALALYMTLLLGAFMVLLLRRLPVSIPPASLGTLFQTTTRFNGFIALAIAAGLAPSGALPLVAVAMALLIPVINISNIIVVAALGPAQTHVNDLLSTLLRNPLIQACAVGLFLNLAPLKLPEVLMESVDLIARAAFGIGLLAVGAGISIARLTHADVRTMLGICLRLVVLPAVFVSLAGALDLNASAQVAGILVLGVPAATNGYIVAKRMGGDAELYADVLSWQSVIGMVTLPLWLLWVV